jgi:hypothetical protein
MRTLPKRRSKPRSMGSSFGSSGSVAQCLPSRQTILQSLHQFPAREVCSHFYCADIDDETVMGYERMTLQGLYYTQTILAMR